MANNDEEVKRRIDYYERAVKNQQQKDEAIWIASIIIFCTIAVSGQIGGSTIGMIFIGVCLVGTVIGLPIYCSKCDERNGIPKANRSSAYAKEYMRKKLEIECRYGFPKEGDFTYNACEQALKALDKEYRGE